MDGLTGIGRKGGGEGVKELCTYHGEDHLMDK